ncbi:MAG: CDC48 family AAA ATPase [Candidatus Hodarchaeales archaeon]
MSISPDQSVKVIVKEARPQDVNRGIVRIDPFIVEKMGIKTGDAIQIIGNKGRSTAGLSWYGFPDDRGRGIIRLDPATRRNAQVSLDERVKINKIKIKDAQTLTLGPTEDLRIQGVESYLRNLLDGRIFTKGDYLELIVMGRPILLIVTNYTPPSTEAVFVTQNTQITISERSIKDIPQGHIPRVSYEDIGGLHDEIQKVREMIELPLKHPELFERLGVEAPKGVLLHGSPGTGKTMLAKAVANESECNFYNISGPEIMSKFYGESEENLRKVFNEAQENSPSIIFIDEIDSIAPKRENVIGEVERRVVAQLLSLMDGLESRGQVVVIGVTNLPNSLDPALRRGGRFDREIEIGIPDRDSRYEILHIHTRGMPLSPDVNLDVFANITHGFVGADLAVLAKEAAMIALREIVPNIDLEAQEIPAEILESIIIKKDHFNKALLEVTPSALREVFVDVPDVRWEDIGGLTNAKNNLIEAVEWPLLHPDIYKEIKAIPPKGILLYGPPGTGKTILAKAVANESQANFISVKGPEFLSKWVGESERAVRETFRKARQSAPCIIFFDEIESIVPIRGAQGGSTQVTERVVSQLLTELDGLEDLEGVLVIAATNRPDLIDPALLRPGRFDKKIEIKKPDFTERLEIINVHLRDRPISDDVDLNELSQRTKGRTGAEISAVVNQAAMISIQRFVMKKVDNSKLHAKGWKITRKDFETALAVLEEEISPSKVKYAERKVVDKLDTSYV